MNKPPCTLRTAARADIPVIARFQVACARETERLKLNSDDVLKGVRRVFEKPEMGFYIVAEDTSHSPVGCLLVLKEWSDWRNAEVWWIHSVYVVPEYRCKGIFAGMYSYIESLARSRGAAGLRLYVDTANESAKNSYFKQGMNNKHYEMFEKMFL